MDQDMIITLNTITHRRQNMLCWIGQRLVWYNLSVQSIKETSQYIKHHQKHSVKNAKISHRLGGKVKLICLICNSEYINYSQIL